MPDWFEDWFDSRYYHLLYGHRDENEARAFLEQLLGRLALPAGSRILDMACGKGRHSVYLNSKGFHVVGADLSEASIRAARAYENDTLRFVVHDMRNPLGMGRFDAVFNLFTSFGYFDQESDNLRVLNACAANLAEDGFLVIDFFNSNYVVDHLKSADTKESQGIVFHIEKRIESGFVVKTIRFSDGGRDFCFHEKVQLLTLDHFTNLFEKTGFRLSDIFGDYNLGNFDPKKSDRLILVARKKRI